MQVDISAAKVLERYASIAPPQRAATIDDWLEESFPDLESQNNTLYAATHILRGDWDTKQAKAWRFVGIGELDPGEEPTDKDIHGAWSRLKKRLDDAKRERDRAYATYRLSREELERREYTEAQLECLMREAVVCEKPDKQRERCAEELTFMASYQAHSKATIELENTYFKYPQKQIGELLGESQPTVARRLKSAVTSLRKCLGVAQ